MTSVVHGPIERVKSAAARNIPVFPLNACDSILNDDIVVEVTGRQVYARYAKAEDVKSDCVGKMWLPRLKSQRSMGRERDAGCDFIMGMSKRERVAMLPAERRAEVMLRSWRVKIWSDDMVMDVDGWKGVGELN
jgi:hypothetical protein